MPRPPHDRLGRRAAVAALGTAAATLAVAHRRGPAAESPMSTPSPRPASGRMPVVYLPHGGGPWPFVELPFGTRAEQDGLAEYLRSLGTLTDTPPRALLVVSAHWEARVPTVMTSAAPPMLFDYYGFPDAAYRITWPAPGAPDVAARTRALLEAAGIPTAEDPSRGFDHGTFVPLKLAFPEATIPTTQLSLRVGLSPEDHLAMGRALAPLRDEGVLIVGSGMSYHNMRGFGSAALEVSRAFDTWLKDAALDAPAARAAKLAAWASAPSARAAHPREEHLLPLMVVAGAAGDDAGHRAYASTLMGVAISAFHYG